VIWSGAVTRNVHHFHGEAVAELERLRENDRVRVIGSLAV
jgi:hypothetical protein